MKTSVILISTAFVGLIAASFLVPQSAMAQTKSTKTTKKADLWSVVQIGDALKLIRTGDEKDERKRLDDDFKTQMETYHELLKVDPKAVKPVKVVLVIKKAGLKREVADRYLEILKQKAQEEKDTTKPATPDKTQPGGTL